MSEDITEKSSKEILASEIEETMQEIGKEEQLYSIALFEILGFSNFVQTNGTDVLGLYQKLVDLVHRMEPEKGGQSAFLRGVVPAPTSSD